MDNTKQRLTIFLLLFIAILLAVIAGYMNTKITTFEECEKADLLVQKIIIYDGTGSVESECVLWNGKSFIKEKSRESQESQRAVEIAIAHISYPVSIIEGKAFNESAENLTKRWDAQNFEGFWHESGINISTEILAIDQNILNSTTRRIEKNNLVYTTRPVILKYNVFTYANITPSGTDGFYPAIGWMGEKNVFLPGDMLARIILEQKATEVKTMVIGENWKLGDGYKIYINSIDAKALARQGWLSLLMDNNTLENVIFPHTYTYIYPRDVNYSIPIFITYISNMRSLAYTDAIDFKYTWLRSQDITGIRQGDTFGIMELISIDNGTIELRNKYPIELSQGNTVNLMGDISFKVENSETGLVFYPVKVVKLNSNSNLPENPTPKGK